MRECKRRDTRNAWLHCYPSNREVFAIGRLLSCTARLHTDLRGAVRRRLGVVHVPMVTCYAQHGAAPHSNARQKGGELLLMRWATKGLRWQGRRVWQLHNVYGGGGGAARHGSHRCHLCHTCHATKHAKGRGVPPTVPLRARARVGEEVGGEGREAAAAAANVRDRHWIYGMHGVPAARGA